MPQHSHAPALLILNGKGAGNEELRQAVKRLRAEQITLYVRVTGSTATPRATSRKPHSSASAPSSPAAVTAPSTKWPPR